MPKNNTITRRPKAQHPDIAEFNNIKRLGHKIRVGGAIHKLYFLIKDELLKESQPNGIVLGISNMRKNCFSLSDSIRIIFSDVNGKILRHLPKFHQQIFDMTAAVAEFTSASQVDVATVLLRSRSKQSVHHEEKL